MTQQITAEIKPTARSPIVMYTGAASNLGVRGQLLVVNQGNAMVNDGNLVSDYGRDCDFVRIALGQAGGSGIASYISYDTVMPPNHMAQWQELCISHGETVIVESLKGQCSFIFTGTTFDAS